jgi:CYTH domain-containing protein
MENPSAPPGKSDKYARRERERRFLLRRLPDNCEASRVVAITDHYFLGTRLRLRRSAGQAGVDPTVYKLTQKVPAQDGGPGLITNLYLSAGEHDLLLRLPSQRLDKVRYSVAPLGVDEFSGRLRGLVLAEAEFASDEELVAFDAPDGTLADVTNDHRFTGGRLAHTTRPELIGLLAAFGLDLTNPDLPDKPPSVRPWEIASKEGDS